MLSVTVCIQTRIYRDGLVGALSRQAGIERVHACSSIGHLLQLAAGDWPDVTLVDVQSDQAAAASIARIRRASDAGRRCAIVALGLEADDAVIAGLLQAGAAGYVTTEQSVEDLVRVLFAASNGELCCSPRVMRMVQLHLLEAAPEANGAERLGMLSRRERQVLELVRLGRSNKEVARELCLEVATVKNHMHNVISKLQVRSRHEAVSTFGGL